MVVIIQMIFAIALISLPNHFLGFHLSTNNFIFYSFFYFCLIKTLASHGGVIGNFIAVWLFSIFVTKKSVSWTVDRLVVPVALVAGLIRLGNLMNSEIYGGVTDLPWGFIFVRDGQTLPMHPTQIYEALCYFVLFGVLMWMYWKKNAQERPWLISGVFFIGVFVSRFLIEYVKNVQVGKEIEMIATYGINMGQLLSIPFIIMGVVMVVYAMTHPRLKLDYPNKFAEELANNKR